MHIPGYESHPLILAFAFYINTLLNGAHGD
jgi:hypothetical protein